MFGVDDEVVGVELSKVKSIGDGGCFSVFFCNSELVCFCRRAS